MYPKRRWREFNDYEKRHAAAVASSSGSVPTGASPLSPAAAGSSSSTSSSSTPASPHGPSSPRPSTTTRGPPKKPRAHGLTTTRIAKKPPRLSLDAFPHDVLAHIVDHLPLADIETVRLLGLGSAHPHLHATLSALMRRHVRALQHVWTKMDTTDMAEMFDIAVPAFNKRESALVLRALQTRRNVYATTCVPMRTPPCILNLSPPAGIPLMPADDPSLPPPPPPPPHAPPSASPLSSSPHLSLAQQHEQQHQRDQRQQSTGSMIAARSTKPPPHLLSWPIPPVAFSRQEFLSTRGVDVRMMRAILTNMPRLRRMHVSRKMRIHAPRVNPVQQLNQHLQPHPQQQPQPVHPQQQPPQPPQSPLPASRVLRTVPDEMGDCEELLEFSIVNHRIDCIPEAILRLRKLRKLVVDQNDRLTKLPEDIGLRLPNLRTFSAEWCQLYTVPQSLLRTLENNYVYWDEYSHDYGLFVTGIPKDYLRALIPQSEYPHLHAQVSKRQKW